MAANESVRAAGLCLRILEHVAFGGEPSGVTQIADATGIAKSAAFKHLHTLVDHGFVVQDPGTLRYKLGPKSWLLSRSAPDLNDISGVALPLMQAARNETGVAVVLSVPTTTSAFVLSTCASNQQIEIGVRPGSQLQLHSSAQGKVFLAFGAPNLLEGLKGADLPAVTPRTITKYEELVADIERVRQRGFATAPEESLLGVRAIAAPVYDYSDKVVGSIGLIGSVQHIHEEPQPEMLEALLKLTKAVSVALGHEKAH